MKRRDRTRGIRPRPPRGAKRNFTDPRPATHAPQEARERSARRCYAASFSARKRSSDGTDSFIMSTSGASSAPSENTYESVFA